MVSTKIKREAIRDADEYAMAKMFYGEGAGIRRRLINQTVQFKIANIPGYDVAFQQELAKQDFAKLSKKARKERKLIDAKDAAVHNSKAIIRGDYRSLSLPLLAAVGVGYLAHTTGYDKKAVEFTKREYRIAKLKVTNRYDRWKHRNDPKVTNLGATGPIPPQV
jgi:hypothetical protein